MAECLHTVRRGVRAPDLSVDVLSGCACNMQANLPPSHQVRQVKIARMQHPVEHQLAVVLARIGQ
jgi:hypothetical protein